jgi:hypothetical protein
VKLLIGLQGTTRHREIESKPVRQTKMERVRKYVFMLSLCRIKSNWVINAKIEMQKYVLVGLREKIAQG